MTGQTEEPLQEARSIDLYPLPEGWKWVTVSDAGAHQKNAIVDGPFGSNLKVSDYVEGGPVPVLTTKNLEGKYDDVRYITKEKFEELKRSAVYPGDILMAKIGSCGKTGIYPLNNPPAMIPANLLKVSLNNQFELKFVYYYFNSSFFQKALRTITKATAQPAFGVTNFRKLPLPYTTRGQQQLIVSEIEKQFSRLDEAVVNLKRVKANLKRYKASVLKAAVEGKLTEDWRKQHPDVEPASKLLERILAERRGKWSGRGKYREPNVPNTSHLPKLPDTWIWVTWESVLAIDEGAFKRGPFGSALKKSIFVSYGYKIYEQYCPINDDCSFARYYITPEKFEELRSFEVKAGDFLISCSGVTLGRITQVPCEFEKGIINQALLRVRLNKKIIDDGYFVRLFRSRLFQRWIFDNSTGSAIPNVKGVKELKAIPIPLPPLFEQQQIVTELERSLSVVDEIQAAVEANLTRADRLRQSILQQAFSGRLLSAKVSDPCSNTNKGTAIKISSLGSCIG